jgi:hypothetical protein
LPAAFDGVREVGAPAAVRHRVAVMATSAGYPASQETSTT